MTIRKLPKHAPRVLTVSMILAGLSGCGTFGSMLEPDRIDYKSAAKGRALEVPPDLTQLQRDNRYTIPSANRGTATASGYTLQQGTRPAATVVAPKAVEDMRIERAGNQRWLVINRSPEELWPQIKDFWQDSGFLIQLDAPQAGVMETDWAENRAKIPQDFIRNTLGKVLDSLYSTGERDKFRTRLERGPNGTTEVYLSHRGMVEELVGNAKENTVWTPRPADPELEAEFLSRLMARLGADATQAKAEVANTASQPARSKLVKNSSGGYVEVDESFERAWRRVGLALDRVGFTVEDRDRGAGMYFVRYVDPNTDQAAPTSRSLLSRLNPFSSSATKANQAVRYRVLVKGAGTSSQVVVLDDAGRPESSKTGDRILSLLNEQLR